MRIFLSHGKQQVKLVRDFKNRLHKYIPMWLAENDLTWGDTLETALQSAINSDVDYLIIFLDADALKSTWVQKELGWALEREKQLSRTFVLPIVFPDAQEHLPPDLAGRLQLVVNDYHVTELAQKALQQLFHLVINAFEAREKTRAFQPTTSDRLQGDWHECHFIYRDGKAQLVREQWHISGHEVKSTSDAGFAYTGVIGEDKFTLVALLEADEIRELVISRLYEPMSSTNFGLRGMWFAVDENRNIECGPEIVTKAKLDDDAARHELQTRVEMHPDLPLMRLSASES
jgi:hypothetical protein